jgi:hypothetical protein
MSDSINEAGGTGPSQRGAEIGVAAFIALLALIGVYGSLKVGIGWASDGPRAGFFPFYVCLIILLSCGINTAQIIAAPKNDAIFAEWGNIRRVLSVLGPLIIYVTLIPFFGIYVASAILITFFMAWFGRYSLLISAAVGLGMPILTFFMFEVWFLVPLPKGPLEHFLGY